MSQLEESFSDVEPNTALPLELERLLDSVRDVLTDDMVSRLSNTATESLDLLDRINRSGIAEALPTLAQMVKSGDLERVANMVRLAGSVQDALSDDIVNRLAQIAGELMCLMDRLARNPNFFQLVDLLGRSDVQSTLVAMLNGLVQAREDVAGQPPAKGGLGALLSVVRDPGTLEILRFASAFGRGLRAQNTQG